MKALKLSPAVNALRLTGVVPPAAGLLAAARIQSLPSSPVFIVAATRSTAEFLAVNIRDELVRFGEHCSLLSLPPPPDEDSPESLRFNHQCDVLAALSALRTPPQHRMLVATTPDGLCQGVPSAQQFANRSLQLNPGQQCEFQQLIRTMADSLGYDAEAVCEYPGQFAVRGGLIDVYPPNANQPFRIDFFGDEIDSIRTFDPATQLSEDKVDSVVLEPLVAETGSTAAAATVFDHLSGSAVWVIFDIATVAARHSPLFQEPEFIPLSRQTNLSEWFRRSEGDDHWLFIDLLETVCDCLPDNLPTVEVESSALETILHPEAGDLTGIDRADHEVARRRSLLDIVHRLANTGASVSFVVRSRQSTRQVEEFLRREWPTGKPPAVEHAAIEFGFVLRAEHLPFWPKQLPQHIVRVTERELFGHTTRRPTTFPQRRLPAPSQVEQLLDFAELADGDYLVHLQSGICIFRGFRKIDIDGKSEEVITLEFDEGMLLHLRLHDTHLLSRYVGLTKARPKLGRLGSGQWDKARAAAQKATLDFAAELLRIHATRASKPGFAFAPDNQWQTEFESGFPFNETADQASAIQATKQDMEKPMPMDRLICGDVGFGKTEVALRAAAKACFSGKQVAVLVPTTVLAQQHFTTFRERFAPFPVVVEMLSRFRSPKEQSEIRRGLKSGRVDIVVGTHSLLSRSINFHDLGLLIVDEEHRFGVRHKEQIKAMRTSVDILTMSATPIPRTLYMALMGARDLSVIETPPADRHPIQTIVKPYSPELVERAIRFELDRGGQVFYLHNRVDTIESVAARIQDLVPNARIGVGHGQMDEDQLEAVMTDFVAGRYDILVCTTIIESGLDIPNANTLIIEGADRFGLAQLYQIRGRVGRFNRPAFAYLLLHRHARLLDQAHKRLATIKQHNQLGAGFRIAMRDLELRGAGNILGAAQSGHIAAIGFDLYCQLLRQSIARLRGEKSAALIRCSVRLDFVQLSSIESDAPPEVQGSAVTAVLPRGYIGESRLQIDFYRRLALADNPQSVDAIEAELIDRFGPLPSATHRLLQLHRIRTLAEHSGIISVQTEDNVLKCRKARPDPSQFVMIGKRFPRLTQNSSDGKLEEIIRFLKLQLIPPAGSGDTR